MKTLLLCSALFLTANAYADTIGTFTGSGPGTYSVSSTEDTVDLIYAIDSTAVYRGVSWTFTAVATTTETLDLNFLSTGNNAYYEAQSTLDVFTPAGATQLYSAYTGGGYSFSGPVVLNLVAGEDYGFTVSGSNYDSEDFVHGEIMLTQSGDTVSPSITPEPSTLALLGTGLLFVGGTLRRRLSSC